jgi:DNA transformation protein
VDPDHIRELFAGFGAVAVRRLFGGAGLFADGVMFGLVSGGEIYLKADAETVPAFESEGCGPFEYAIKTGKRALNSYWRLPERLYDDPEELAVWAARSLALAQRRRKPPVKRRALTKKAGAKRSGRRGAS